VLGWCRDLRIEPPSAKRIERRIRSVLHRHEAELFATMAGKLSGETCARLDALLQPTGSTEKASGTRCRPRRATRRPGVRGRRRARTDFRGGGGVCFPEPAEKICKGIRHAVQPFVGGVGLGALLQKIGVCGDLVPTVREHV
jgi:hypothetical protein